MTQKQMGSYVLIIELKKKKQIQVGKLGNILFKQGLYAYIGSALRFLDKRVERHIKTSRFKTGNLKWHIDFLLADRNSELIEPARIPSSERLECSLSRLFQIFAEPIRGFGSSDCKCKSHLYYLGSNS